MGAGTKIRFLAYHCTLADGDGAKIVYLGPIADDREVSHFQQPGIVHAAGAADAALLADFCAEQAQQRAAPIGPGVEGIAIQRGLNHAPK